MQKNLHSFNRLVTYRTYTLKKNVVNSIGQKEKLR